MKKRWLIILTPVCCLLGLYVFFPALTFGLLVKAERGVAGLARHSVDVGGERFEYLAGGEGEPLVLLHGFGANKDSWTRIASHLTPHFKVIAPDLTGFGASSVAADGDYRIARQVERLQQLLAKLGIDSLHLGGNSMGGYLAGMYAAQHPEQIKSLWLLAPSVVAGAQRSELQRLLAAGKPNPLLTRNVADYEHLLDFVFTQRPYIPAAIKEVLVAEAVAYQPLHQFIYQQMEQDDSTPALERLLTSFASPVLILWGADDRVLDASGAAVLAAALPGSYVEVLAGTGHLPMLEQPALSAAHYLEFSAKQAEKYNKH